MIEVVCVCKRRFEVQDEHAGLSIKCPECRRLVSIPGPAAEPIPDTIPPPGLQIPPDAMPPLPEWAQPAVAAAPQPRDERLVTSLESLIQAGRTIQVLLACILGVLVLMLLQSWLRR